VGVQTLYAVHGGLGGLGGGLSPFGGVDLAIFSSSLSGQVIGSPPTAEAGDFDMVVNPPGSITVQGSLGNFQDTIIVLNHHGGGECAPCQGVSLKANFFSASGTNALDGKYMVSWISVQENAGIKSAPFVIRGSDGREIARVRYSFFAGQRRINYNNDIVVGSWQRQVAQKFEVLVDLDAKTTSLAIDGVTVISNVPFVTPAENLASIAAEFIGPNSGIMGWAEIAVIRLEDE
jgi:hypothetical protein